MENTSSQQLLLWFIAYVPVRYEKAKPSTIVIGKICYYWSLGPLLSLVVLHIYDVIIFEHFH